MKRRKAKNAYNRCAKRLVKKCQNLAQNLERYTRNKSWLWGRYVSDDTRSAADKAWGLRG